MYVAGSYSFGKARLISRPVLAAGDLARMCLVFQYNTNENGTNLCYVSTDTCSFRFKTPKATQVVFRANYKVSVVSNSLLTMTGLEME